MDENNIPSWLRGLNEKQIEAAVYRGGPLLILAGAGSGKTRVIVHRIAHLIQSRGADPSSILAVTFTNKAAEEMQVRVSNLLGPTAAPVWVSTFHSLGAKLLRRHLHLLGYSSDFVIYDDTDQLSLIKQVMKDSGLDPKAEDPKSFRAWVDAIKREGREEPSEKDKMNPRLKSWVPLYEKYQARLRSANAVDFGDLLLLPHRLFEKHPELRDQYRATFRHVLVDEYQDTNHIQYLLIRQLAGAGEDLCVVGDEDQSIYGWRGANIRNILDFERDFPRTKVILLEQNYRSTRTIIEAASGLIGHNQERKAKKLWTGNQDGEPIRVYQAFDAHEEARWVTEEILKLKGLGRKLSAIAIFYRTHAQSRLFEEELREAEVPHAVYGGPRFYDRKEIKDVLAYLKFLENPADEVSLMRVINLPVRGLGDKTIALVAAARQDRDWPSAIQSCIENPVLPGRAREGLKKFRDLIAELALLAKGSLAKLVEQVIDRSGYRAMLEKDQSIEALSRLENLEELINAAAEHEAKAADPSLSAFLERLSLAADLDRFDPASGQLTLMTLHGAKGLEFPVVFMVGLEEGVFPHARSLGNGGGEGGKLSELEEERRLCYVGMTRARSLLYLTLAAARNVKGYEERAEPSRFLQETPDQYLTRVGPRAMRQRAQVGPDPRVRPIIPRGRKKTAPMRKDFGDSEIVYDDNFAPEEYRLENGRVLHPGDRVRHRDYGEGVIKSFEGEGQRLKVIVRFDRGAKKFLASLAPLEPLE